MTLWKPKPGAILKASRIWHFGVGFVIPALCNHLWGYEGLGWGFSAVMIGGVLWEKITPWIKGPHPFADLWDALFTVGGGVAATILGLFTP